MGEYEHYDAFAALRRQLNSLNYVAPLGIESAPLVRAMLDDLLATTEVSCCNASSVGLSFSSGLHRAIRKVFRAKQNAAFVAKSGMI